MSNNFVQNQYIGIREQRGAVWLTAHGSDLIKSVSTGLNPADGSTAALYRQIVEGTVLSKRNDLGLHFPCALDSAQAIVTAANDIIVADPLQFAIGQMVELPVAAATGALRFRLITAIDYDTSTITLDGAVFTLSSGDAIEVDGGRSLDALNGALAGVTAVVVDDGTKFEVGDVIEIVGSAGTRTVEAIAGNTLTVDANTTAADNALVVSNSDGKYKITDKTVTIDLSDSTPQNVLLPCRPHGEVKEILVIGLTPTAKTALEGLVIFNERTIA